MSKILQTLIESFVSEALSEALDEKLRGGFDLNLFKQMRDPIERERYAMNNLTHLGEGSSRTVYALSSGKVLKLAFGEKYEAGKAQNEAEVELTTNPRIKPVLAMVYDFAPDYSWLISEITRPFKSYDFEQAIGLDSRMFEVLLMRVIRYGKPLDKALEEIKAEAETKIQSYEKWKIENGKQTLKDLETINLPKITRLFNGLSELVRTINLDLDDLMRSDHYGLTGDGRVVVIDYGYNKEIGRQFYAYEALHSSNDDVLTEGGLAGHMQHLYDNKDLTFGDLKEVFSLATQGKLEQVSEKLDGQNFFFTYDVSTGQVKFARNKGNIKTGGMTGQDIAAKWADVPTVAKAFGTAYQIMTASMQTLSPEVLTSIFGPNGNIWFSAEVVSSANPNVINYDRNVLVFHRSGTAYDQNGRPIPNFDGEENFQRLVQSIEQLQKSVASSGWKIAGPVLVPLKNLSTKEPLQTATTKLTQIQGKYGLGDGATIREYLKAGLIAGPLKDIPASPEAINLLATLMVSEEMGIAEKKRRLQQAFPDKQEFLAVAKYINEAPTLMANLVIPIEQVVHDFAVEILNGVHSMIVLSPEEEVRRLQGEVKAGIDRIKASGNQDFIQRLDKELERLKSVDKITSSLEGIVFKFKNNVYKFTGAFAPVNQILGLVRYGRGGVKI
ncbi:MAG: hypothetical protein WC761_00635 [Candidatus Paceibacterota bacterium]|jgi:hypothetical protein